MDNHHLCLVAGHGRRVEVVEALERCGGVAERATLLALTSRRAIRASVESGMVLRTGHGRYALPAVEEAQRTAHAVGGVVSGRNAAVWWGWEVKELPRRPDVTVPKHRRRPAGDLWRADLHPSEVHEGFVTTQERTLLDCLRRLSFDEALAVADSALRHGFPSDLLSALAASARGPGSARIRRAAAHASSLAANPFESVLRALAIEAGLDVTPQVALVVLGNRVVPDLSDASRSLVLEADSFEWHGKRSALRRDARRYTEMVVAGWRVLRFAWEDVMHDQAWVLGVLQAVAVPDVRTQRAG